MVGRTNRRDKSSTTQRDIEKVKDDIKKIIEEVMGIAFAIVNEMENEIEKEKYKFN